LSKEFIDITEIIEYLEVPIDTIHLVGAKILTNTGSEENAIKSIDSIDLIDKNLNRKGVFNFYQKHFLTLIKSSGLQP
jgi:hypothetical protein